MKNILFVKYKGILVYSNKVFNNMQSKIDETLLYEYYDEEDDVLFFTAPHIKHMFKINEINYMWVQIKKNKTIIDEYLYNINAGVKFDILEYKNNIKVCYKTLRVDEYFHNIVIVLSGNLLIALDGSLNLIL